jgi:RNA polymerase sigma-70 factor, ECF subfamily
MNADLDAIRRLKKGDIAGLEVLVTRYQAKAMRAAFLILRDEQAAEDVSQATFIRVFEHIQRFDESRPFGPYLLRSVVNAALDLAQKSSQQAGLDGGLDAVEELLQQGIAMEDQAEFNLLKRDIQAALDQLSARQRAAIVMRYYLEMSEKEMAENLQTAPGTVKWLLNAARERLRVLLGERSAK